MFCTVFGLSMDYEVLLLSRIQEEYLKTHDNTRSVAMGLEKSGRLITGAAAIMVGVFAAFALADIVLIKAIGLGMALAVAIDATLVRALVVPATMRLLGDLNWWAPGPLARLQRRSVSRSRAYTQAVRPPRRWARAPVPCALRERRSALVSATSSPRLGLYRARAIGLVVIGSSLCAASSPGSR